MKEMELPNFSLGWELEATARARRPLQGIEVGHDSSVGGEQLEYRTSKKIVFDSIQSLEALRHLSTDAFIKVDRSCGFHVHIGLGKRSRRLHQWAAAFIALARHIEESAFTAVPESRLGSRYCKSWSDSRSSILNRTYYSLKYDNDDRYNWVNPVEIFRPNGIRTIEVRLMGDTKRYPYLLAWVAFCRIMAEKAWVVSFDISREQEAIDELKEVLSVIRDNFRRPVQPKIRAKNVLFLANKAKLYHPFGNVLSDIRKTEESFAYMAMLREKERETFKSLLGDMARSIAQAEPLRQHFSGSFCAGDTVRCVRVPSDGGLTEGGLYRVVETDGGSRIIVLNDVDRRWLVNNENIELVERMGAGLAAPVIA